MLLRSLVVAAAVAPCAALVAGPLDPPAGPIAPTHKTLTQVEPRTPISAATTPGDADSTFRISQPGSYYLTGNVIGESGKRGIEVAADNVTIDLRGFTLSGVPGSPTAISASISVSSVTVTNGIVVGWDTAGIFLPNAIQCHISDVTLRLGSGPRIRTGDASIIRGCTVTDPQGSGVAILTDDASLVDSCTVSNGPAADRRGITTGRGATVSNCVVVNVRSTGILCLDDVTIVGCRVFDSAAGIATANNSTIRDCDVSNVTGVGISTLRSLVVNCTLRRCNAGGIVGGARTTVTGCALSECTGGGIVVAAGSSVTDCAVTEGNGGGIVVNSGSAVTGCSVSNCGGGGIVVNQFQNRIERNHLVFNDIGLRVLSSGNIIFGNTASTNSTNFNVVANNVGLFVLAAPGGAAVGNAGGAAPGSADNNTNYAY